MSESSAAAEQVIRIAMEGTEYVLKIAGRIGTDLSKKLSDALRDRRPSRGRYRLRELLRSGKELSLFSIMNRDVDAFARQARRYGITYSLVKDRREKDPMAAVDVIVKKEDVIRVNRVIERYLENSLVSSDMRKDEGKKTSSLAGRDLSGRSSKRKEDIDYSRNRESVRKKLERLMGERNRSSSGGFEKIRKER